MSDPITLLSWLAFGALAVITVLAGALTVTLRNLFHSALALIVTLLGIAGLLMTLSAGFVAAMHIVIYVGAISTLFIFVVMLTVRYDDTQLRQSNRQVVPAIITCGLALALLIWTLIATQWTPATELGTSGVHLIGTEMLTAYLLPFEVVTLLLLIALVGAVTLAAKEKEE